MSLKHSGRVGGWQRTVPVSSDQRRVEIFSENNLLLAETTPIGLATPTLISTISQEEMETRMDAGVEEHPPAQSGDLMASSKSPPHSSFCKEKPLSSSFITPKSSTKTTENKDTLI